MPDLERFATARDFSECRQMHRVHGTTYYFSTLRLPTRIRPRVHALYGFVRQPDEWVDNPGKLTVQERLTLLESWRQEFRAGLEGICPKNPVLRAFCDVAIETQIPIEEPMAFIDSMALDLSKDRYSTYEELQDYMRGSAAAVGVMMCYILEATLDSNTLQCARALAEAMQLTNFLRDIREDIARGRIYIPLKDMASFQVSEKDIHMCLKSDGFVSLMKFEINRARALYAMADDGIERLPRASRSGVRLARVLYSRILDRIEERDYDVFSARVRTSKAEKLAVAASLLFS